MSEWKFKNTPDVEDFTLNSLGIDLLISAPEDDAICFYSNGDMMTIWPKEDKLIWEPLHPGEMSTSKLSLRLHQWFGKGIIVPVNP